MRSDQTPASEHDGARFLASWPLTWILIAIGAYLPAQSHLNLDISWFVTFAESVWNGAKAYRDIGDPNPPAAFLLYMPAVALGQFLPIRIEALVVAQLGLCLSLALWLAERILATTDMTRESNGLLRNAVVFLVWSIPGYHMLAEREHFALVFVLPILAVYGARAKNAPVESLNAVLAGLAAGLALCIKPYYGAVLALPTLSLLVSRRSLGPFFSLEHIVAIALSALYGVWISFAYPAYFSDMLPVTLDVYAAARVSPFLALSRTYTLGMIGLWLVYLVMARRHAEDPRARMLLLASIGFGLTYFVQGKLWANHAAPALELGALALAALTIFGAQNRAVSGFQKCLVGLALIVPAYFMGVFYSLIGQQEHYPGWTKTVQAAGLTRPSLLAISKEMSVGFPLARNIDGKWVARQNSLWRVKQAEKIEPEKRAQIQKYVDQDYDELIADIRTQKPDLILTQGADELRAITARAGEDLLAQYEKSGELAFAGIEPLAVWRRTTAKGQAK